jgi:hypothetical protein
MSAPPSNAFKPDFGAPNTPPAVAALPKTAAPTNLPSNGFGKEISGKLVPGSHADKSVHGVLHHKRGLSAGPAQALANKHIDSYEHGYTDGPYLPVHSASGMNAKTDLYGQVLKRKH